MSHPDDKQFVKVHNYIEGMKPVPVSKAATDIVVMLGFILVVGLALAAALAAYGLIISR